MTTAIASPSAGQDDRTCDESCPYYRVGLPLVIARVALLPENVPVAELSQEMLKGAHPDHGRIDPPGMRYGLRLPRAGYLYKLDENLGEIEGFRITEDGYFFPLDRAPGGDAPPPCNNIVHQADASMVTIANANRAEKPIWFALSDTEWTDELRQAHLDDQGLRARHMVSFNAKQWLDSQQAPGAVRVRDLSRYVYDYSWDDLINARQKLEWSPDKPRGGLSMGQLIEMRANVLLPEKAAVLALPDPVGLTSDLAALMQYRAEQFANSHDAQTRRRLAVCQAIDEIEFVVKGDAENDLTDKCERQAREWEAVQWRGNHARPANPARARQIRAGLTAERLDEKVDGTWKKYLDRFDSNARQNWRDQYNADFQAFNEEHIGPLAQMHRAWMESDCLKDCLIGNHDGAHAESGAAYVAVLNTCIGSSQDKGACFDLYQQWLEADDDDNPLQCAFAYNQLAIREEVRKAITPSVDWAGVPWDRLAAVFELATAQYRAGQAGVLGHLIGQVLGPIEAVAGRAASSGKVYRALAMLGAAKKQPFVMVTVSGRGASFWAMLVAEMVKLTGEPVSNSAMRQAILRQLRRMTARGVPMDGLMENRWLLMIDPDQVRDMPETLKGPGQMQARAAWLAANVKTPKQVQRLRLSAWQSRMRPAAGRAVSGVSVAGLGALGLMTQHLALSSLQGQLMRAMEHQRADVKRRLLMQWMQVTGAYTAAVGRGMELVGNTRLRLAKSLRLRSIGQVARVFGKFLGIFGAVVMAGLDTHRGFIEASQGNRWRSAGYFAVGFMGVMAVAALWFGATGVGLIVVVVLIAASLLLDYFKPDNMQLWLERCYEWGRLVEQRYRDERTEKRELDLALGRAS
ncbi:T6SS effector BTH_I2691 family protein [Luteimonas sp. MJ293]|uniref:T6SS effector BTH_I2691 family protein n=1 Tax=Luteimonas sp. MJ146 TaxID=3129240 RepID=UPI0031BB85C6